jgi:hypothetical protein
MSFAASSPPLSVFGCLPLLAAPAVCFAGHVLHNHELFFNTVCACLCGSLLVQVSVQDISSKTCMFSLVGPQADEVLQRLQAGAICDAPYGSHTLLSFQGVELQAD